MKHQTIRTDVTVYSFDELGEEYRLLINRAKEQTVQAYAPYSGFQVGAAVLLDNGRIITGSNQENAAYPSGLCAERVALFYANSQYPDVAVRAIAIAARTNGRFLSRPITPCGACRQVLLETENRFGRDIAMLFYGTEAVYRTERIRDLLPLSFIKGSMEE